MLVESGSFRFQVSKDKIERISRAELKKSIKSSADVTVRPDPLLSQRKLNFKPEIDLSGVSGERRQLKESVI